MSRKRNYKNLRSTQLKERSSYLFFSSDFNFSFLEISDFFA